MVDEDTYCIDVLTQVSAATRALQSVAVNLLDQHLRHCVADAISAGDEVADARLTEASPGHRASRALMSRGLSPLVKLAAYAVMLVVLFAGAYAVGSAVPDASRRHARLPAQLHDAPPTTDGGPPDDDLDTSPGRMSTWPSRA